MALEETWNELYKYPNKLKGFVRAALPIFPLSLSLSSRLNLFSFLFEIMGSRFLTYFFVFMILSHHLLLIEGRKMKVKKNHLRCGTCMSPDSAKTITKSDEADQKSINNEIKKQLHHRIADGFVDAFRPTTPGHSPGVGHSLQN